MEKRRFGRTDMEVSVLGFGGAEIGYEDASLEDVERLLGSALDAGLNVIDTAECYADSEEKIGRAVGRRRNDFHLFTKCGHTGSDFNLPDWDPKMLEQSIDRSLKRLRTDHVDLVQLHSCGRDMLEQGDVIAVLQRARDAGKTRYIGYSGDRDAAVYAIECGAFDSLQTSISIADQEPLTLTVPKALEREMGVIAKRPIANAVWKNAENPGGYPEEYWNRLQKLNYPFLKKSMDEAVSVALRFTLGTAGVHTAIVGTKNPQRWVANARLLQEGALPQEQIAEIRARWSEVAADDWTGQG
ncbi:MAG TPA: aldo/keto reductase [Abditibacteriaceae bacterium]|jgi:hypothetical protein